MIVRTRRAAPARGGAALVELALVMIFILFPLTDGILQVGRLILVQQMVSNAARDACRVASQGVTIQENGAPAQIIAGESNAALPAVPSVRGTAYQSLRAAGLKKVTWADTATKFKWYPRAAGDEATEVHPHQGVKNQAFEVTVSVPWESVRWPSFWNGVRAFGGGVSPQDPGAGTRVSYAARWRILVDDTFTINVNVPGVNPIR